MLLQSEESEVGEQVGGDVRGEQPGLVDPSCSIAWVQACSGKSAMARSSTAVMVNSLVNATLRRAVDKDSRCSISPWLAPAPSRRIRILRR